MTTTRHYLVGVAVAWVVLGLVTGCGFADPTQQTAPATAPVVIGSAGASVQSSDP